MNGPISMSSTEVLMSHDEKRKARKRNFLWIGCVLSMATLLYSKSAFRVSPSEIVQSSLVRSRLAGGNKSRRTQVEGKIQEDLSSSENVGTLSSPHEDKLNDQIFSENNVQLLQKDKTKVLLHPDKIKLIFELQETAHDPLFKEVDDGLERAQGAPTPSANKSLDGLKNISVGHQKGDIAVFWHIPKAGGSTLKDILRASFKMRTTWDASMVQGNQEEDERLKLVRIDGRSYVNIDTSTVAGLKRAKSLGIATSGLVDVVVTHHIYETNDLFDLNHQGRVFAIFRHPVDRAVSLYNHILNTNREGAKDPDIANMTLQDFAQGPLIENNWMTRSLSNTWDGPLTSAHLEIAKEVLQQKVLVGLLSQLHATMDRFERFFRWRFSMNPEKQERKHKEIVDNGFRIYEKFMSAPPYDTRAFELIAIKNIFDIQLYGYVESLFQEQEKLVARVPVNWRLKAASCCVCDNTCGKSHASV